MSGQVCTGDGEIRLNQDKSDQVKSCQSGTRTGQYQSGQVMSG